MSTTLKLILAIAIPLAVGSIGGYYTTDAIPGWYSTLNPPAINPPNWVFGPVWTVLYILMGISLFWIWTQPPSKERNTALFAFGVQMLLNLGWSFIFFYYRELGYALVEIVVLWLSIVTMLVLFYKIKPKAAYINVPYILWVSFAMLLNAGYYTAN